MQNNSENSSSRVKQVSFYLTKLYYIKYMGGDHIRWNPTNQFFLHGPPGTLNSHMQKAWNKWGSCFLLYDILSRFVLRIIDAKTFLPRCMNRRRGLAMRILSVCPSVCLSVTRVDCDETVEWSVQIYIPHERTFSLVFWKEEWFWGDPLYLKFGVNRPPLEQNRRFWTDNRS